MKWLDDGAQDDIEDGARSLQDSSRSFGLVASPASLMDNSAGRDAIIMDVKNLIRLSYVQNILFVNFNNLNFKYSI